MENVVNSGDSNQAAESNNNNAMTNEQQQPSLNERRNKFWNISNDEHYNPKTVAQETTVAATTAKHVSTALTLQHTQAALELHSHLFPTHLSNQKLRNFHRMPLRPFYTGPLSNENIFNAVRSSLRKFKSAVERPQFQLNFSSGINIYFLYS